MLVTKQTERGSGLVGLVDKGALRRSEAMRHNLFFLRE